MKINNPAFVRAALSGIALLASTHMAHSDQLLPSVSLEVNGIQIGLDLQERVSADGSVRTLFGDGSVRTCDGSVMPSPTDACAGSLTSDLVTLEASFKTDPFITWAVGVTNTANTSLLYNFLFAAPYVGGPYDTFSAELATNTVGSTRPVTDPALLDGTVDGSSIIDLTCASHPCSTSGTQALASATDGVFGAEISFTLPGPSSSTAATKAVMNISGRVELSNSTAIPEPSLLTLLALTIFGIGLARRLS